MSAESVQQYVEEAESGLSDRRREQLHHAGDKYAQPSEDNKHEGS